MRFKIITIIALLLLLVIFALQNAEIVELKLWFWSVKTPGVLLILISVSAGVIIGMIASHLGSGYSKKTQAEEKAPEESEDDNFFK
jgi:putative membrane protein